MEYFEEKITEELILEPDDWTEEEWETILKLFGMEEAERIVVADYTLKTFGTKKVVISEEQWNKAKENVDFFIREYAMFGPTGIFGLQGVLVPMMKRYERGERTQELYDEMMSVQ